jgi:hypothetical protein
VREPHVADRVPDGREDQKIHDDQDGQGPREPAL